MTAISLGMPSVPTKLAERRKSRQIQVGTVPVGGDAPVSVQSMTTTRTSDIGATLQQIAELTASGCQIVRVACPTQDDADALATIARKSQIPVIADIHFQPKYVFAAIEAGCAAVRVNPATSSSSTTRSRRSRGPPMTTAPRSASVSTPAPWTGACSRSTARPRPRPSSSRPCGRRRSSRSTTSATSRSRSSTTTRSSWSGPTSCWPRVATTPSPRCDGGRPAFQGTIKSAVAFGPSSPRASATRSASPLRAAGGGGQGRQPDPGVPEPQAARPGDRLLPSCGRAQSTSTSWPRRSPRPDRHGGPLRVAVMGCVVNGPGEAREADLGVASGNGKGQIFVKARSSRRSPSPRSSRPSSRGDDTGRPSG